MSSSCRNKFKQKVLYFSNYLNKACLLLLLFLFSFNVVAKDTITWVTESFEPYYISSGPMEGKGIGDRLNQAMIDLLPEYEHNIEHYPILRITEALKKGEKILVSTYLKNPKDKGFAQYSITSLVTPPLEITIRKQDWVNYWDANSSISIDDFLQKGYVVGIAGRRYYGDNLSPILYDNPKYSDNVYVVQSTHYRSLAEMVSRKRIDATVGYVAELKYYNFTVESKQELVSVPIDENPGVLYAYVVAPKNEWGDKVLERLNPRLAKIRKTDEYQAIMFDWFGKSPDFERVLKERFESDI